MLLNSFVGVIYQGLRKVCATSGPCISTRTWFVLNGSPCLIELTRCGRKTNQPSSIAWRPLCQPSRCGRKTNQPSSIAWRPLCQPTRCGRKTKPSSVAWWPLWSHNKSVNFFVAIVPIDPLWSPIKPIELYI